MDGLSRVGLIISLHLWVLKVLLGLKQSQHAVLKIAFGLIVQLRFNTIVNGGILETAWGARCERFLLRRPDCRRPECKNNFRWLQQKDIWLLPESQSCVCVCVGVAQIKGYTRAPGVVHTAWVTPGPSDVGVTRPNAKVTMCIIAC